MKGVSLETLNAMICAVNVEPMLAPMIMGTVWPSVISPADTKPTRRTVVMVEEFSKAVIAAPASTPLNRLEVMRASTAGRLAPAMAFRPSVSSCRPNRNKARPAASSPSISTRFKSPAAMRTSTLHDYTTSTLAGQRRAYGLQLHLLFTAHLRICELQFLHRLHDRRCDHEPREPLVVGRHDEPGGVFRGGSPYSFFVGMHIVGPETPLAHIGRGE